MASREDERLYWHRRDASRLRLDERDEIMEVDRRKEVTLTRPVF
jgi:hypothetical protein